MLFRCTSAYGGSDPWVDQESCTDYSNSSGGPTAGGGVPNADFLLYVSDHVLA